MILSPRQRVLTTLSHQQPDRVPLALWGSWYGVTDRLYFNVLNMLDWQPVAPFRPDRLHSVNFIDDRLLARLGVDIRHVDPGATAATSRIGPDGSDGWGLQWDTRGLYRTANHHPLQHASLADIRAHPLPDAEEVIQPAAIKRRLADIDALDADYAIAGRAVASYGFFEMAQSLRKHDVLLMDLALKPDLVQALIERLSACYTQMTLRFLDLAGPRLDLLELPGDDFAGNKGPIISLQMFDDFFKEPYRRLIEQIKNHSPHIKVVYHSDGAITPFLSRLIEIGVDVVHPLEPLPATDLAAVKADYGDRLCFLGGVDIRQALQGDAAGVINEVETRIRQLAPGGGYILAPANHLQWDIPPQNLFTLYDTARQAGCYP